jgi:hypothetical protein
MTQIEGIYQGILFISHNLIIHLDFPERNEVEYPSHGLSNWQSHQHEELLGPFGKSGEGKERKVR